MTFDHFIKARYDWVNFNGTECNDTSENSPDPADVLKDLRREAIYEWEKEGEIQSLEASAYSNRDRRKNKYPKFKCRS